MPKRVAIELVERAGIDVGKLLERLVRNVAPGLTTLYSCTILRVNLIGLEGAGLKQIAGDGCTEERNRCEALLPGNYELRGKLPNSMVEFHNISACLPASLPADPSNVRQILEELPNAEQCAARGTTRICEMTAGKDHRTDDLSRAILHEEIKREAWFSEFLGHGPCGHDSRDGTAEFILRGQVPYRRPMSMPRRRRFAPLPWPSLQSLRNTMARCRVGPFLWLTEAVCMT
jgi:ferritin-like protein